ncbi:Ppx/GppA phosphatase family protein [Rhizobium oryzicola]|uniref:Ppx/GppA phosphatase family protein n=1 Tax=Rhizobium oryzicola TaxID=1232668 RepID=A0ABT8SS91_9HYPH|nr:Ppx/GppA phosphatase family protein [Rhizobium oryzicola]MDO1581120.1 Ppx/GppA phosphatase family protein [Rhizobium oryzicola]
MMNPDSGDKPPEGGASTAGRQANKGRRRRKGKRGGKPSSAPNVVRGVEASHPLETGRSETGQPGPTRKRKRRRSNAHKPVNGEGHQATAKAADAARGEQAGAHHKRKRGKHQAGRGLQGRPLANAQRGASGAAPKPHAPVAKPTPEKRPAPEARPRPPEALELVAHLRARSHPDDLYAALDLGTNNCRLLIAQPTRPGHFRVVDAFSRIVRLGEGLAATGRLSDEAMDRAVEALRICASKLASRSIRRMRLIATEACRAATNGEAFLARVTAETGLELEIIDRETEARLAVSGCSSLVGREARSVVLFDIGGGSSEIAVIRIAQNRSSRLANHITHWTSLPVGVVTLSERHGGRNVTPEVFEAMVTEVEGMLAGFQCPPISPDGRAEEDFHLIGTSGTVTTLAGVHLDLPRYDRRRVDGLWLSDAEVNAMQAKLLSWNFEARAANPCIGPDRADLVLAGCAILEAIRRRWPSRRMRVADRGLREGLLTDMMADDGVWRRHRIRRPQEQMPHQHRRRHIDE